jgi:glycosyltransferase involved in cell wall biosynthesis
VVVEGETGLLVPIGDERALADAIRRLVEDPALSDQMGRAGYERARAVFSLQAFNTAWQAVYREVQGLRQR